VSAARHASLRRALVETARAMNARGIGMARTGNVSARIPGGMLITPTGMAYESLKPADIVAMDMHGTATGSRAPSSEWRFHLDIYRARPEVGAVVHTHSNAATALSCLRRGIPPFHYMVAAAGGPDIRCAEYATFGTEALSRNALAALGDRKACLLANHGVIATGADLDAALELAEIVEGLAAQYLATLHAGKPVLLSRAEMARVARQFAGPDYGQPSEPAKSKRPGRGARGVATR
jgi:L-fuculose-phosphate aldolase